MTATAAAPGREATAGEWMHALARELYPIPRSLTGDGVRATLARIADELPSLAVREVASGTPVFDWTVPREWNLRSAWIEGPDGERVLDVRDHGLHVLGYSTPVRRRMPLTELREHVWTLPDQPDLIPYRTSYYAEEWGFCMTHAQLASLPDGEYEVCIDATLADGLLTYGELLLPGSIEDEVLLSAHVCHPMLANDNLSGIVVAAALARSLASRPRRHTFRFLFAPGTIGAIAWLARNEAHARERVEHGLVLTCVGDPGDPTYKRSRRGDALVDRAVAHVLRRRAGGHSVRSFSPYGYDERQFCSPGFDLPVGCLMRTPWGEFPEYHTSGDDLSLITPDALADSLAICSDAIDVIERDATYVNLNPNCEPQLGRRGLYDTIGGAADPHSARMAILWVLNGSDGSASLLDIAERAELPFAAIADAAELLVAHDLLALS